MISFIRAALSFSWLEIKAFRYYPLSGILQVIQSFVSVGIWFFVSLFLQDYASFSLVEYGGDFVAYMVIGVLFFQNTGTMLTLPFQSLSTAFWDKRLEVYHSQRYGIWAFIVGQFLWLLVYNSVLLILILVFALYVTGVKISSTVPLIPALSFYTTFVLTCFGLGLIGASNFFFLEVKQGREPVSWLIDVLARLFSGVYYPLSVLPLSVQWITWAIPHTYALRGIRQVMINGQGFTHQNTFLMFGVLAVFCVVSLILGIRLMNRAISNAERGNGVGILV